LGVTTTSEEGSTSDERRVVVRYLYPLALIATALWVFKYTGGPRIIRDRVHTGHREKIDFMLWSLELREMEEDA